MLDLNELKKISEKATEFKLSIYNGYIVEVEYLRTMGYIAHLRASGETDCLKLLNHLSDKFGSGKTSKQLELPLDNPNIV